MACINRPILSICIPTYNRADYLKVTLESIVTQRRFQDTHDVEIVISDNCSDDHTKSVIDGYIKRFGGKILYFRNVENVKDRNMEIVLSKGSGLFLKLNNDTLKHNSNTLDILLSAIDSSIESKNILFFLNQSIDKVNSFTCENLDEFVRRVSYYSTWIASFGIWKDDFDLLKDFSRYANLQLTQTDVLHRIISNQRKVFVNNDLIFISQDLPSKGGYDIITVFLDNYTYILKESLRENFITKTTYKKEIINLLIKFICSFLTVVVAYPEKYKFEYKSKFHRIISFYKAYPQVLFVFFIKYYMSLCYKLLKKKFINKSVLINN